jgi:hypothetical protein
VIKNRSNDMVKNPVKKVNIRKNQIEKLERIHIKAKKFVNHGQKHIFGNKFIKPHKSKRYKNGKIMMEITRDIFYDFVDIDEVLDDLLDTIKDTDEK